MVSTQNDLLLSKRVVIIDRRPFYELHLSTNSMRTVQLSPIYHSSHNIGPSARSSSKKYVITRNVSAKEKTAKQILQDFGRNTTLLGVSHFIKRRSVIWLVAYLCCLATSIGQSWKAGEDYFNNKASQKVTVESRSSLPFPSVTVCSYSLVLDSYNFSSIRKFNLSEMNYNPCAAGLDEEDAWESWRLNNDNQLVRHLRRLSDEERSELSVKMLDMIHSCKFGGDNCDFNSSQHFFFFNNPFYGNCFTFNPAFKTDRIVADLNEKLTMIVKINNSDWIQIGDDLPKIGLLLHTPGTAPVLESSMVSDLYPGQNVEFTLRMSMNFFDKDLSTGCVDRDEVVHRTKSLFYSEKTPYLYSVDGCMKSCSQMKVMNKCKKIDAIMPVQSREESDNIIAEIPPVSCDDKSDKIDMESCGCPLPCEFIQYTRNTDTTAINDDCQTQGSSKKKSKFRERIKFSINFLTTVVNVVYEEPVYSLPQFLGILGGNLSLWIGLCVVSLLEIIELGWKLLVVTLKSKNMNGDESQKVPPSTTGSVWKINFSNFSNFKNTYLRFRKK